MNEKKIQYMPSQYLNVKCKTFPTINTPFWHKTGDKEIVSKFLKYIFGKPELDFKNVFSYFPVSRALAASPKAFFGLPEPDLITIVLVTEINICGGLSLVVTYFYLFYYLFDL